MPAPAAVIEIGPVAVRRIAPLPAVGADTAMVAAALAAVDDPVALLDERPVDIAALWRSIIGSMLDSGSARLTLVVPSWWSQLRVDRVVDAAATVANNVIVLARWRLLASGADAAAVIELADEFIAISAGGSMTVLDRACAPEAVARAAIRASPAMATIVIDAPVGVPGVAEAALRIRSALENLGRSVAIVPITDVVPAGPPDPAPTLPRRSPLSPAVGAAAVVALVLCGVGAATGHRRPLQVAVPSVDATDLVEGRITVRVPLRWNVTRVTAGPGSRRVQVTSVDDRDAALHITQSYVPGETLDTTAEVLRHELDNQPPGVFTDFLPHDRRAGRAVVTYRETRSNRDIGWVVLVDGATRIAIGCQSGSGRADAVAGACDEAVSSAREITGTVAPR